MNERRMVLLYNHADPDESFVTVLTEEEIQRARKEETEFSAELLEVCREREMHGIPSICYYA